MEWRKEDKEALRAQRWFPAFQARLGGDATAQFKGVLCYAPVKRPLLPKSMCKSFGEGEDGAAPTGSGIMALEQNTGGRCERPKSGFLCRQSVSALQRAGVPTNVFLELQQEHFDATRWFIRKFLSLCTGQGCSGEGPRRSGRKIVLPTFTVSPSGNLKSLSLNLVNNGSLHISTR